MTLSGLALVLRLLAVPTGLCAGVAVGFLVTDGDVSALVFLVLSVATALGLATFVVPRPARLEVLPLVAFATLLRAAVAIVLYEGLLAAGRGGFVTGDDATYAGLSARLAALLHGHPAPFNYGEESYLLGTFVYLETGIFYLAGPQVLLVEILNSMFGGVLVAFVYDIGRRVFADARAGVAAAVAVAIYPSLVLWSALNLKDSLTLLLIAVVLWVLEVYQARPRFWLIAVALIVLVPIQELRSYIFVGLGILIPAVVAVTGLPLATRAFTVAACLIVLVILLTSGPVGYGDLDEQRAGMGIGANTSFADQPVGIRAVAVLFAPFPWAIRRPLDLLPIPEMLVWYGAFTGAIVVVARHARLWRPLAPLVVFIGGVTLVFFLAEGNVGTVFRHRAMIIPFVLVLAAPAAVVAFRGQPRPASVTLSSRAGQPRTALSERRR